MAIDFEAMTSEQIKRYGTSKPKPNKYRARRTEYNGVLYDSKVEAEYAKELDRFVEAGAIAWWIRQATIPLGPDFKTRVDFLVARRHSSSSWLNIYAVEVKGVETREFKKVRELWAKYGPFSLHVVKRGQFEVIEGKR